ncbi:MAG TPA: DHA2 family efflux MFS transporter permease subunit [Dongiaceae bacterium]|nr:DHA2 family efflux MFS transporter permease subunit [Dongiaceae bacterium]
MADAALTLDASVSSAAVSEAPPAPPVAAWKPAFNPWLIGVIVAVAAFMEVLDTSIANVALPYIGGNLGASTDQSTWVLTSYLVSNAIVLPISGWFSSLLGRKRFFMTCLAIFTVSSLLCGLAPSLGAIIFFRVLQGAGGGGLQPIAQAILADTFPPEKRGLAFALYGVTVIVAPTIGPTLGGWITDNYSWRWIFFINIPVGILALFLVLRLIDDPPWARRKPGAASRVDYIGISLLTLGVGALQIMLDKGQEDDWFSSSFILTLAIIAGVGLVSLVLWEWFYKEPIIDVKLLKNGNFLKANVMMFMLGVVLFASLVMLPLFLQSLLGYTAQSAGIVLSGGGLLLLFMMPMIGVLSSKVQARYLIAFGWITLSIAMFYSSQQLQSGLSFRNATILRVVQVFGMAFLFVPINLSSYIGMPTDKSNSVAGIVNFMRNVGSSVGTSMVTTIVARRAQVHQVYLSANITSGATSVSQAITDLSARLMTSGANAVEASRQAYAVLYRQVILQATTLAYVDAYVILAIMGLVMFGLSFTLKRNELGGHSVIAE